MIPAGVDFRPRGRGAASAQKISAKIGTKVGARNEAAAARDCTAALL